MLAVAEVAVEEHLSLLVQLKLAVLAVAEATTPQLILDMVEVVVPEQLPLEQPVQLEQLEPPVTALYPDKVVVVVATLATLALRLVERVVTAARLVAAAVVAALQLTGAQTLAVLVAMAPEAKFVSGQSAASTPT